MKMLQKHSYISSNYRDSYRKSSKPECTGNYSYSSEKISICGRELPWDTQVLNRKCARIDEMWVKSTEDILECKREFHKLLHRMDRDEIQLSDVRISMESKPLVAMVKEAGYRQVDTLNIYLSEKKPKPAKIGEDCKIVVQKPTEKQTKQILEFGMKSFQYSRLYQDSNISTPQADTFYGKLLESTLNNKDHIPILALNEKSEAVGFCVGGSDGNIGFLWMIAVHPSYTGKGVASGMLQTFLSHMHETYSLVEIGTQDQNIEANALYQRFNLELATKLMTFHRWKNHSKEEIATEYNEAAKSEMEHEKVKWGSREKMINRFQRAMQELPFAKSKTWLDVGAGTGAFEAMVSEKYPDIKITGIDLSKNLLEFAKQNPSNNGVRLLQVDFFDFKEKGFDIITTIGVLQKTNMDLKAFFKHAHGLLNPSGNLYVDMKFVGWDGFQMKGLVPEPDLTWYSQKQIHDAAENAGFEIVKFQGLLPESNTVVAPEQSHTIFMIAQKRVA